MLDKIRAIISPIAPVLGGMLGGPMGVIAGNAIKQAMNLPENANEEDVLHSLETATLQDLLRIKEQETQLEAIHQRDRESARGRQIKLAEHGHKDYTLSILAYVVIGGFFGLSLYILQLIKHGNISGEEQTLIGILLGYAAAGVQQVISYFFGSSIGSKAKDKFIEVFNK